MRRLWLITIVAGALLIGCAPATPRHGDPTENERLLPFTGNWKGPLLAGSLHLYQQDAERVIGSWEGGSVSGLVRPDGRLDLAASQKGATALVTVRLHAESLYVERAFIGERIVSLGPLTRAR